MNPAKRKKLYRLELQKKQSQLVDIVEEKVVQKEEVKPITEVLSETAPVVASTLEIGLKLPETEVLEARKDKKKKLSSQDS